MRSAILSFALVCLSTTALSADSFPSTPTQLKKKVIYARAAGQVTELSLKTGQVFLWDELAASVEPSQNVRPEFGRAYSDFAGAVSRVLVSEGQRVEKGDPLYECRLLEHVYTSCTVPTSLPIREDQPIEATYRGEKFEGKVLSVHSENGQQLVNVIIYNSHEARYWHLTHGQQVTIHIATATAH